MASACRCRSSVLACSFASISPIHIASPLLLLRIILFRKHFIYKKGNAKCYARFRDFTFSFTLKELHFNKIGYAFSVLANCALLMYIFTTACEIIMFNCSYYKSSSLKFSLGSHSYSQSQSLRFTFVANPE
jgi:hypothetical protein